MTAHNFPRSPATQPPSGVVGDTLSGASANADQALAVPTTPADAVDGPSGFDPARDEVTNLRETLRAIIRHCGGGTRPTVSSEFLCLAAEEVRLALIAAEKRGFEKAAHIYGPVA